MTAASTTFRVDDFIPPPLSSTWAVLVVAAE
jgi:hypothetical protein